MTLTSIGLDNRYPSVARRRHATEFRHNVNNLGHITSPWSSPFMNPSYSSILACTQLVYDLTQPDGEACVRQSLRTSTQAMLQFRLPLWQCSITALSNSKLSHIVPKHPEVSLLFAGLQSSHDDQGVGPWLPGGKT